MDFVYSFLSISAKYTSMLGTDFFRAGAIAINYYAFKLQISGFAIANEKSRFETYFEALIQIPLALAITDCLFQIIMVLCPHLINNLAALILL